MSAAANIAAAKQLPYGESLFLRAMDLSEADKQDLLDACRGCDRCYDPDGLMVGIRYWYRGAEPWAIFVAEGS